MKKILFLLSLVLVAGNGFGMEGIKILESNTRRGKVELKPKKGKAKEFDVEQYIEKVVIGKEPETMTRLYIIYSISCEGTSKKEKIVKVTNLARIYEKYFFQECDKDCVVPPGMLFIHDGHPEKAKSAFQIVDAAWIKAMGDYTS